MNHGDPQNAGLNLSVASKERPYRFVARVCHLRMTYWPVARVPRARLRRLLSSRTPTTSPHEAIRSIVNPHSLLLGIRISLFASKRDTDPTARQDCRVPRSYQISGPYSPTPLGAPRGVFPYAKAAYPPRDAGTYGKAFAILSVTRSMLGRRCRTL